MSKLFVREISNGRAVAASVSAHEFDLYRLDDPVVEKICELVCDSLRQEIELQVKRWF